MRIVVWVWQVVALEQSFSRAATISLMLREPPLSRASHREGVELIQGTDRRRRPRKPMGEADMCWGHA